MSNEKAVFATNDEVIAVYATKMGISKKDAKIAIEALGDVFVGFLEMGMGVKHLGIATYEVVDVPERKYSVPARDGQPEKNGVTPAHKKVKVKAGHKVKKVFDK